MFWIWIVVVSWGALVTSSRCAISSSFLAPTTSGPLGLRVKRDLSLNPEFGYFIVVHIESGSPSTNILHINDTIVSLDGESTQDMSLAVFSAKLNQLRSTNNGLVKVDFYSTHCPDVVPYMNNASKHDDGQHDEKDDDDEDNNKDHDKDDDNEEEEDEDDEDDDDSEDEDETPGFVGYYRIVLENFQPPLGLSVIEQNNALIVSGKPSSNHMEQWKPVQKGDILSQIQGEEINSLSRLKTILMKHQGRKSLGVRFYRKMLPHPSPNDSSLPGGIRIHFNLPIKVEQTGWKLAMLKNTGNHQEGFVAIMENAMHEYIIPGDRIREMDGRAVLSVPEFESMMLARRKGTTVDISFIRGVSGTMEDIALYQRTLLEAQERRESREFEENERIKKLESEEKAAAQEKERLEKHKVEQEEKERLVKQKVEQEEKERLEKQKFEQEEKERLEKQKVEQEEKERLEKQKLAAGQLEKDRLEKLKEEEQQHEKIKAEQEKKETVEQQEKKKNAHETETTISVQETSTHSQNNETVLKEVGNTTIPESVVNTTLIEECSANATRTKEDEDFAEFEKLKIEAEVKAKEAEELRKKFDQLEREYLKKKEEKDALKKKQEDDRKQVESLKLTRIRLEKEWKQLEKDEVAMGLSFAPMPSSEEDLFQVLSNPQFSRVLAKELHRLFQESKK